MDTSFTTEAIDRSLKKCSCTNSPYGTKTQSIKSFATTEANTPRWTGVVAPPTFRHKHLSSLPSDLPLSDFVAPRVNNVNMTSAITRNVILTDAYTLGNQRQSLRSWADSILSEESELDHDSHLASLPTNHFRTRGRQPSMKNNEYNGDKLPSQSQPSPDTPLSRYRPGTRMIHVLRPKRHPMTEDIVLPPDSFANEETSNGQPCLSKADRSNGEGVVENKGLHSELLRMIGDSAAATAPSHQLNKTSISQMNEPILRDDPQKPFSYGTETFRATSRQFIDEPIIQQNIASPNSDIKLKALISNAITNTRAREREPLLSSSRLSSTKAPNSRNEPDTPCLLSKTTPEKRKEHERTPSNDYGSPGSTLASGAWNAFDSETFSSRKEVSLIAERLQRPLCRVEKFSHVEKSNSQTGLFAQQDFVTTLSEMHEAEVCSTYPLEAFVSAGAEGGCNVLDWACPWPPEKPAKKFLRFASQADFAPSAHSKSDVQSSADLNTSLHGRVNTGEYLPDHRKSTLRVVDVPDQAQDGELTALAPLTYSAPVDDETSILFPPAYDPAADDQSTTISLLTYDAGASDETTTLLPLRYGATANVEITTFLLFVYCPTTSDESGSPLSTRRKPIPREFEDRSRRTYTSSTDSENDHEDENENNDDNEVISPRMESGTVRNHSPEGRGAELKRVVVGKKHVRSSDSTGLLDHVSKSVGKFIKSDSDTDVVEKQMPANSITRRPLPGNTGLMDRDLECPARDQNKRGVSMPTFPPSSAKGGGDKKHSLRSSFNKLLNAFGKNDKDTEKVETNDKPKESLGRRISRSVGKKFPSLWPK